jgi:hypothetical protein
MLADVYSFVLEGVQVKDIHKTLAERSLVDAVYLSEDVQEEYGVAIPEDMVSQFALAMYQHRVQRHRMKEARAEQEQKFPAGSPDQGRY